MNNQSTAALTPVLHTLYINTIPSQRTNHTKPHSPLNSRYPHNVQTRNPLLPLQSRPLALALAIPRAPPGALHLPLVPVLVVMPDLLYGEALRGVLFVR